MGKLGIAGKVFVTLMFSVNLLIVDDLIGVLIATVLFSATIPFFGKNIEWQMIAKLSRGFLYIFSFTFAAHYFIQDSSLLDSAFFTTRLIALIVCNAIVAASISIDEFIGHIDRVFKWLPFSREVSNKWILIFRLALNFVPILKEEGMRIYKAQKARGTDFSSVNPVIKANSYLSLMIPILVATIKKADDVALAMKARRFTGYIEQQKVNDISSVNKIVNMGMAITVLALTAANLLNYKLY